MEKQQICLALSVVLLLLILFKSVSEHFQNVEVADAVLTSYMDQYNNNVEGTDFLTSDCYISCAPGAVDDLRKGIEANDALIQEFKKEEKSQLQPVSQTLYPGYYLEPK